MFIQYIYEFKNIQTEQSSENINKDLDNILEWLNTNKLSLNVKKTKFMIFHYRQRKIDNLNHNLKINSEPIERVQFFWFNHRRTSWLVTSYPKSLQQNFQNAWYHESPQAIFTHKHFTSYLQFSDFTIFSIFHTYIGL